MFSLKPLPQKQHNCDIMFYFKVFYYYDILSIFCCNGLLCLLGFLLNYTATITGNTYEKQPPNSANENFSWFNGYILEFVSLIVLAVSFSFGP